MEIWKDIVGYEGLYQVSSIGRIKSIKFGKEKILKELNISGYKSVRISFIKGNFKNKRIHRLVYETFVGTIKKLYEINHIDGDKGNNKLSNLECITHKENIQHAVFFLKKWDNRDYSKFRCKGIEVIQYDINNKYIKEWKSIIDVQKELGIFGSNITQCCKGKSGYKTAGGFIWEYKNK